MSTANQTTTQILDFLKLQHCKVWRNNNLAVPGRKFIGKLGVSDIIGFTNKAKFIAVEVKAGNDKLSDKQKEFLTDVSKVGGIAIIAHDFDGFYKEWLELIKFR